MFKNLLKAGGIFDFVSGGYFETVIKEYSVLTE